MTTDDKSVSDLPDEGLWCVNITGPDDIIAATSRAEAIELAQRFNTWWAETIVSKGLHPYDPTMWAVPIAYPNSPDGHADNLKSRDALEAEYRWLFDLSRRSPPSGYRLVPVEPTDGWQPIETAPKDGTRVLLFEPDGDGGEIVACVWGLYFPGPHNVPEFRAIREYGWVEFSGHSGGATIDHPTHWQPLPAAPSPKEGK